MIRHTMTADAAIRMNIPPIFIGANIFFNSCETSALVLLLDDPVPLIRRLLDILAAEDITELYIAVMDAKKQPTNPNTEETAVIIEIIFSREFVIISIAA